MVRVNLLSFIVTWDPSYLGIEKEPVKVERLGVNSETSGQVYRASNGVAVARLLDGTVATSDCLRSVVHTGRNTFEIRDEVKR